MDRPKDSQKPATSEESKPKDGDIEHNLVSLYLVLYNWVSAVLWAAILGRVLMTLYQQDYTQVYEQVGWLTKWTQTLAALEMLHSAFRIVRAPFITTLTQVSSRFFLVWIIVDQFPHLAVSSPAYTSMLIAWSVTEVIRYTYFTGVTAFGDVPDAHKWLRYNSFIILYPLGISSEVWMTILALEPMKATATGGENLLFAVLAFYGPGSYMLFTHMLKQRKKVMRGFKEANAKKTQ